MQKGLVYRHDCDEHLYSSRGVGRCPLPQMDQWFLVSSSTKYASALLTRPPLDAPCHLKLKGLSQIDRQKEAVQTRRHLFVDQSMDDRTLRRLFFRLDTTRRLAQSVRPTPHSAWTAGGRRQRR